MRKTFLLSVSALLLVPLLALSGCSGQRETSDSPYAGKAQDILDQSNRKMAEVRYMKVEGSYAITSQTGQGQDLDFSFKMDMDLSDPEKPAVYAAMERPAQEMSEVYTFDGYRYSENAEGAWQKTVVEAGEGVESPTPVYLEELSSNARNVRMVSEDSSYYRIAFDLTRDFIEEYIKSDILGDTEAPEDMVAELVASTGMTAVLDISREDRLIRSAVLDMNIEKLGQVGEITLRMELYFSGFNEPVEISLPEDAAGAVDVTPGPGGTDTLPDVPGISVPEG
jgi:Tfp pilus assembly protein PilP